MIYKMFDGRHIDLSKILEITPVVFIDKMGSGGWFVSFSVIFQLFDTPRVYTYDVERFIEIPGDWTQHVYDTHWVKENIAIPAVAALQLKVNIILDLWKYI